MKDLKKFIPNITAEEGTEEHKIQCAYNDGFEACAELGNSELSEAKKEIKKCSAIKSELFEKCKSFESQLSDKETEIEKLKSENNELVHKYNSMQDNLATAMNDCFKRNDIISDKDKEIERYFKQLECQGKTISEQREKIQSLQSQLSDMAELLEKANTSIMKTLNRDENFKSFLEDFVFEFRRFMPAINKFKKGGSKWNI
jgi:chromosome segregation ATPase